MQKKKKRERETESEFGGEREKRKKASYRLNDEMYIFRYGDRNSPQHHSRPCAKAHQRQQQKFGGPSHLSAASPFFSLLVSSFFCCQAFSDRSSLVGDVYKFCSEIEKIKTEKKEEEKRNEGSHFLLPSGYHGQGTSR